MKKLLIAASALAMFACGSDSGASDVTLYFMPTCPHCHNAINFIDTELKGVSVEKIDVTKGGKNLERFNDQLTKCNFTSRGVPLMVVKGKCLQGFAPEVGEEVKKILGK
ncbi:MAG: glutaredoxin family protein [Rickettsiales bacterium]|jgi:glutaredoxin|nr:glutaredoxin family protein [Rickettsiales bacterium]